jgi:hypothetical protein
VSRDAVLALGGWSAGGTEEIYGGGLLNARLSMVKVQDLLDLSYLEPRW